MIIFVCADGIYCEGGVILSFSCELPEEIQKIIMDDAVRRLSKARYKIVKTSRTWQDFARDRATMTAKATRSRQGAFILDTDSE